MKKYPTKMKQPRDIPTTKTIFQIWWIRLKSLFSSHVPGTLLLEIPCSLCEVCEAELLANTKQLYLKGWRTIEVTVLNEKGSCCQMFHPLMKQIQQEYHLPPLQCVSKTQLQENNASPLTPSN